MIVVVVLTVVMVSVDPESLFRVTWLIQSAVFETGSKPVQCSFYSTGWVLIPAYRYDIPLVHNHQPTPSCYVMMLW